MNILAQLWTECLSLCLSLFSPRLRNIFLPPFPPISYVFVICNNRENINEVDKETGRSNGTALA